MADFHRIVDTLPDITRRVAYLDDWVHYYRRSDGQYLMSEHIQGSQIEQLYIHEDMTYPGGPCPCRQCQ